jgi:hypothetical protein
MKTLRAVAWIVGLIAMAGVAAYAGPITSIVTIGPITFSGPLTPGSVAQGFAVVTNNSGTEEFLTVIEPVGMLDSGNNPAPALTINNLPFGSWYFAQSPDQGSIAASSGTGSVEWFDIDIASNATPGTYTGTLAFEGGSAPDDQLSMIVISTDPYETEAFSNTESFSITVQPLATGTPEPASMLLMGLGLLAVGLGRRARKPARF